MCNWVVCVCLYTTCLIKVLGEFYLFRCVNMWSTVFCHFTKLLCTVFTVFCHFYQADFQYLFYLKSCAFLVLIPRIENLCTLHLFFTFFYLNCNHPCFIILIFFFNDDCIMTIKFNWQVVWIFFFVITDPRLLDPVVSPLFQFSTV